MKYKKGDKILQISNGIFIRLGVILSKTNNEYEIKWVDKGNHVENLTLIRKYTHSFIENEMLFDLVNNDNIDLIIEKYLEKDDFETCSWIRDNLSI
jgi:hypothetical protein